jgi:hypothetical protein
MGEGEYDDDDGRVSEELFLFPRGRQELGCKWIM